jgi:parallel beta-helix repeat protein
MKRFVSGLMLTLLVTSMLTLMFNVQPVKSEWIGTVYIRADGSIHPPDAPITTYDNTTYTLIDNITTSGNGIIIEGDNIVLDGKGNTIQGPGSNIPSSGIWINERKNVTIRNINIRNFWDGIYMSGLFLNNTLLGNHISNNNHGIHLEAGYYAAETMIYENLIIDNYGGIYLDKSGHNIIFGNNITKNEYYGIGHYGSHDNIVFGNNIVENARGIYIYYKSSNNVFYHNNFKNNIQHVEIETQAVESVNAWDSGYPIGGNYFDDYRGIDCKSGPNQDIEGSDGIGDVLYIINDRNKDKYPLKAPFYTFKSKIDGVGAYNIDVVSNSIPSNTQLNSIQKTITVNISGLKGTDGFCRMIISNNIVQSFWHGNYVVLFDGEPWPFKNWTDATNTYIYINYTHSEHQILIIPEFPTITILPLLMLTTLITTIFSRKKKGTKLKFP